MKGTNRLELLMFHLGSQQQFCINVLKVKEIIDCPPLTALPFSHPFVCGVARLRGEALSVIDLSHAIGKPPFYKRENNGSEGSVLITEFNRIKQGFLVEKVDKIIVRDWKNILPPPKSLGSTSFMTGVTDVDDKLVQLVDVEKVLSNVVQVDISAVLDELDITSVAKGRVLIVDDSALARKQIVETMEVINLPYAIATNGKEAFQILQASFLEENETIAMVVSDIEMPEMDGYTLTESIRQDDQLKDMYVLLHTSLSGEINIEKANQAGANDMLTKFVPEELMQKIVDGLQSMSD